MSEMCKNRRKQQILRGLKNVRIILQDGHLGISYLNCKPISIAEIQLLFQGYFSVSLVA